MVTIKKVTLKNFKRFKEYEVKFNDDLNIIIGDNEVGKSTILESIDLVLSGSISRLQNIGIENLFNVDSINNFLDGSHDYSSLPEIRIEVFLDLKSELNADLNGTNHLDPSGKELDGLVLVVRPDDDYSSDIQEIINSGDKNFPFEYYRCEFFTFGGKSYNSYKKYVEHLLIDSSQINSEYAAREYIKTIFNLYTASGERSGLNNLYRQQRNSFESNFKNLNDKLKDKNYKFVLKTDLKSSLESGLTLSSNNVPIEQHGNGKRAIIKTQFALNKGSKKSLDLILLEEPENHLSHINTRKLIFSIAEAKDKQIFIATHSSLIATRLELNKAIVLAENKTDTSINFSALPSDTSKFFLKAPNHKVLEFILSSRVILVEGDAEYILISEFYKKVTGSTLDGDGVHVIEVGGKTFKRYMDLANLIPNMKIAVITDNDGDYETNCDKNYLEYTVSPNIKIFYEKDNAKSTFEKVIYRENTKVCDDLFLAARKTLTVENYMLSNKTESAFNLVLKDKVKDMHIPSYITEAIEWIRK